jgi:hypothetical protein
LSRLRLADADRERLGCPEFLTNPLDTVTVREAIELQKLGYKTPTLLAKALVASDEGPDYSAWTAFVWLALRRAGVECDPATLDFDIVGMQILADEEPPEHIVESGKAPAREGSTNSRPKSSTRGVMSEERLTPTGSPS